jgi:hypothetical protein
VVRHFIDAVVRDVADRDAALLRCPQIDVIDADAVPHDDLDPPHFGNDFRMDRRKLRDHGVGVRDEQL